MKNYIFIGCLILIITFFALAKNNQNCLCNNCSCLDASSNICKCEK